MDSSRAGAGATGVGGKWSLRRRLLLSALVLAGGEVGGPRSLAHAAVCNSSATTAAAAAIRVEDLAGANELNSTVSCTGGGQQSAIWAGAVALDAAIVIGNGTFLSVTGGGETAEAQGGLSTRIFVVSPGGGLTLSGMKLSGGKATDSDGGGAIYAYGANLTLEDCVFNDNQANNGDGGAVSAEGGGVSFVGGEFFGNIAAGNGGAVSVIKADVTISGGTRFEQNDAVQGGALYTRETACHLNDTSFLLNKANDKGGAWAFFAGDGDVVGSVFSSNWAQFSGGGVFGDGTGALVTMDGCVFEDNVTPGNGGALHISSATLRGGTELRRNSAGLDGGGIHAWDTEGAVVLEDLVCTGNVAADNGGCIYASGRVLVSDATVMRENVAYIGGCIFAETDSAITVEDGNFSCIAERNGGFLMVEDGAQANITGGVISNNVAGRRGAAVYCRGDSTDLGVPNLLITGGTFTDNEAGEVGGAIVVWGALAVVSVTGGVFENNSARFYGGFIFIELGASASCEGATIRGNSAGDQGGGIYARDAPWVTSSCGLLGNVAPQGAAAYLTYVANGAFENLEVAGSVLASGGSAVFITASAVSATRVTFQSGDDSMLDAETTETTRAVQLDDNSTFFCDGCVFDGWLGDAVILSANAANGSLVLASCDFSGSSSAMAVISPYSDAEVRNAMVGDKTLVNAQYLDPLKLVDRALECTDPNACGANGECVDSALGVLCECLPRSSNGDCLDDGGTVSLTLKSPPDTVTYDPSPVSFDLLVSAADDGTTFVIWELSFAVDELLLTVVPWSGILPPGGNATVTVTGIPVRDDVGGNMVSRFVLMSVGGSDDGTPNSDTASSSGGMTALNVSSIFYLCPAFQYAKTEGVDGNDTTVCEQCTGIDGSEGVDCNLPGATVASLPIKEGYWRSSKESLVIHSCMNSEACVGATEVSGSDDYCAVGYEGPYCAVCVDGYGKGVGRACHSCVNTTTKAGLLITAAAVVSLAITFFFVFAVIFLIGGLDAVGSVRRSMASSLRVLPTSTSWKVPRFASNTSAATKDPLPSSTTDASRASQHRSGQGTCSSAVGSLQIARDCARSTNGKADAEVMISGVRSPVATVAAGSRLLGLSRVDSTNYDANGTGSRSVEPSTSDPSCPGPELGDDGDENKEGRCYIFCAKIKNWGSRLPFGKLKILVVVWQILTVFPSITGVNYPPSYSRFLSVIDFVNFDLGQFFSATCLLPSVTFYERLLATTLAPLVLAGVLVLTYQSAMRRAGIGSRGIAIRRAAWSRHMAAGLLLTFLVFTSASTIVFKTFACDEQAVERESYLREDYRLSCKSTTHVYFMVYAGFMILVYPVGIPLLYFSILWKNRHLLNPSVRENTEAAESDQPPPSAGILASTTTAQIALSPELARELEERVNMRKQNPDLVPSMFLWKDFGPSLYYYEVVECGRRILLTGVLIFIAPHSSAQAAMSCIFAFASLLGFELLRPHLDPADSWLYRLGCVVIFLSNFLALLIKVEAAGENQRDTLGGLLVAINVILVLAVLLTTWFATQQQVDDSCDESTFVTMAKRVAVTEGLPMHPPQGLRRSSRSQFSFSVEPMHPELTRSETSAISEGPRPSTVAGVEMRGIDGEDEDAVPTSKMEGFL